MEVKFKDGFILTSLSLAMRDSRLRECNSVGKLNQNIKRTPPGFREAKAMVIVAKSEMRD